MDDLVPRKAHTLREALNKLDPERPLNSKAALDAFFVARPDSPIDLLQILLEETEQQKILFTGHRGSGKSTELAKLSNKLQDKLIVIRYSAKESTLNPLDLNYVDVVLSIGLKLFETAAQLEVALNPGVIEEVLNFTREITKEVITDKKKGKEGSIELKFLVAKITGKLSTEDTTRMIVRETVKTRITDLLESIRLLATEIWHRTSKRVLVIVEDLDKADLKTAKELFYEHARPLLEPAVSVIYTFPVALRHDNTFMQVQMNFPEVEVLPNIKTEQKDETPYPPGIEMMQEIVRRRVEEDLFAPDALEKLAMLSGGVPRELIALARQAVLEALLKQQAQVDLEAVERAAQRKRRDYDVLLSQKQRQLLGEVHRQKTIDNEEIYRELLHNLSVLEYRNAQVWHDVHPLARHLIEEGSGDE